MQILFSIYNNKSSITTKMNPSESIYCKYSFVQLKAALQKNVLKSLSYILFMYPSILKEKTQFTSWLKKIFVLSGEKLNLFSNFCMGFKVLSNEIDLAESL